VGQHIIFDGAYLMDICLHTHKVTPFFGHAIQRIAWIFMNIGEKIKLEKSKILESAQEVQPSLL